MEPPMDDIENDDPRKSLPSVTISRKGGTPPPRHIPSHHSMMYNSIPTNGVLQDQLEEKVLPFIELIDRLREMGIDQDVPLPSIAVVGDQSSGKSSVLEALSGVSLPRGSGIVTRCPLQLKLRKVHETAWTAVISYRDQRIKFNNPDEVAQQVKKAQDALAGEGVGISDELISLEIMSPTVCDLTLIDLPGIARVPVPGQPEDIGEQIKKLTRKFIERSETIILVVIASNVDIATTEALKMAQDVDPEGTRTLAILTKPDLIDRGTEKHVLELVRNRVIPLKMGYIIVKCRGQKQIDDGVSVAEAIHEETEFFKNHEYFRCLFQEELSSRHHLATKLTRQLVKHIKESLPQLTEQIHENLWGVKEKLSKFQAGPPKGHEQRRKYLIEIIAKFNKKIDQLSTGDIVNNENMFTVLRKEFNQWNTKISGSRDEYAATIQKVVEGYNQTHRRRELLGFYSYSVFEDQVKTLMMKLKSPAVEVLKNTRLMVQKQFTDVSKECFTTHPFLLTTSLKCIENIQTSQEAEVMKRIVEQFEMEMQVYTQDEIFKTACAKMEGNLEESRNYPNLLKAYYEIALQRLADQVPMLIRHFILKQSALLLTSEMLSLLSSDDLADILREEAEVGRRRAELEERIVRLSMAQDELNHILSY